MHGLLLFSNRFEFPATKRTVPNAHWHQSMAAILFRTLCEFSRPFRDLTPVRIRIAWRGNIHHACAQAMFCPVRQVHQRYRCLNASELNVLGERIGSLFEFLSTVEGRDTCLKRAFRSFIEDEKRWRPINTSDWGKDCLRKFGSKGSTGRSCVSTLSGRTMQRHKDRHIKALE
jgi:hypothetical protein